MSRILAAICLLFVFNPCQVLGEDSLPEGPGKEIVLKKCQSCHDLDLIGSTDADPRINGPESWNKWSITGWLSVRTIRIWYWNIFPATSDP